MADMVEAETQMSHRSTTRASATSGYQNSQHDDVLSREHIEAPMVTGNEQNVRDTDNIKRHVIEGESESNGDNNTHAQVDMNDSPDTRDVRRTKVHEDTPTPWTPQEEHGAPQQEIFSPQEEIVSPQEEIVTSQNDHMTSQLDNSKLQEKDLPSERDNVTTHQDNVLSQQDVVSESAANDTSVLNLTPSKSRLFSSSHDDRMMSTARDTHPRCVSVESGQISCRSTDTVDRILNNHPPPASIYSGPTRRLGQPKSQVYVPRNGTIFPGDFPISLPTEKKRKANVSTGLRLRARDYTFISSPTIHKDTSLLLDGKNLPLRSSGRFSKTPGSGHSSNAPSASTQTRPKISTRNSALQSGMNFRVQNNVKLSSFYQSGFGYHMDHVAEGAGMSLRKYPNASHEDLEKHFQDIASQHLVGCQKSTWLHRSSKVRSNMNSLRKTLFPKHRGYVENDVMLSQATFSRNQDVNNQIRLRAPPKPVLRSVNKRELTHQDLIHGNVILASPRPSEAK